MSNLSDDPSLRTARLEALSDGVFAIVMTLLVFEVRLPNPAGAADQANLWPRLIGLGPILFSYAVSFIILGVYWAGHRSQFTYIRRANLTLTWLNLFFLMSVALVPFSAQVIGQYPRERLSTMVYGVNLMLVAVFHLSMWAYATGRSHLIDIDTPTEVIHMGLALSTAPLAAYVLAIALSFVSTTASLAMFALVPIP
jgi:uncharacterized membrane protein